MIVCCGEALIDFLPRKTETGAVSYQPFNGGSIFNTAIALGRLGVPTGFFGGLSTDFFGESLKQGLAQSNIDLRYTKIWDKPSTLAFVKLEGGHARYSFFDDNSAGRMLTRKDLPRLSTDVEALHFGSISLIPDPGATTLEALMARETRKRVICLDPNIRPGQIRDRRSFLARINRLTAMADILKISEEDVKWVSGSDDLARFAKSALRRGAGLVVVTRGGEGVEVFSKRYHFAQPARKVTVADTVGAGDTFTAGLLAALRMAGLLTKSALATIDQDALAKATAFAARAAAVTVSRPGADPPWAHEMA